jgi:DNA-binding NtrC family response regulator
MESEAMSTQPQFTATPALIGQSPAIRHLRTQLQRIGPYFRRVLLTGESGTGKHLAAHLLHQHTPNAAGPFVCCDAATISASFLDHSKITPIRGADPECLLSAAQGGTLYLARVCEMPLAAQEQLVQLLCRYEQRHHASRKLETRIIASTRRDLRVLTAAGLFRQDLYHRLSMVEIALPPLRSHPEDITLLAAHLLGEATVLSGEALQELRKHAWPGNVRELENVLRSAALSGKNDIIEPQHLPMLIAEPLRKAPSGTRLQDVIDHHVLHVLEQCEGNKVRAAELLGISRSTLYRMLDTGFAATS